MPVLPSWGTHRVYATYRSLTDGSWLAGTVTVSLPVDVHSVTDDAIIPKGRHINAQPLSTDSGGHSLDITVPASDDPDNLPQDFYVEIVVQLTEPRVTYTYKIPTPLGGETNLRTILDPTSVTVDGPLYVGVAGGLARLSEDGTTVLDASGDPISTGGAGGTDLTSYSQVSGLADYPTTFPADLSGLATVATSGAYGDLSGKPTIPQAYDDTALSGRVTAIEGAGYITAADVPDAPTWDTLAGKPAVIAAGTSMTAARDAIGAGTSSLVIGTGSTTAAAGDHTHTQYATNAALTSHSGSTANPHSVTAAQVGALATSTATNLPYVIAYGSGSVPARPAGASSYAYAQWRGTADPTANMATGDEWVQT